MDCAKGVGARLARPNKSLAKMEGILHVMHKLPLLIAVPTTAGAGSETTLAAVITDADTHHKYAINDFSLIPHYAVLEPEVTVGLPAQLTATTGMDALTHAIEAYIGRSTTKQTREAAIEAIQLIFQYLPVAYKNGKNPDSKKRNAPRLLSCRYCIYQKLCRICTRRSTQSGRSVRHPAWTGKLRSSSDRSRSVRKRRAQKSWLTSPGSPNFRLPRTIPPQPMLLSHISEKVNASMNIPTTLAGIRHEDIPKLARYADKEANPLYPVPILWDDKQLALMYHLVQEKKEKENNSHAETGHRDYTGISA